jgi:O-antigen/teichoic acid export membrane protein
VSLFSSGLLTFVTRMVVLLINIPTSIIIARTLGAGGQGTYTAALLFTSIFCFVTLLGMDSAYTYFLSGRRYQVQAVLAQGVATMLVLTLVTTPLYLVFAISYGAAVKASFQIVLVYAAVLVPIGLAKWVGIAFLVGFQDIRRFNLLTLLSAMLLLGMVSVSLLVLDRGVKSAIAAYAISDFFFAVAALVSVGKKVGFRAMRPAFDRKLGRASLSYGLKGHLGAVLVQLVYRFDTFLIVYFLGVAQQGFYSIAVLLAEKLSHLPNSIQIVLFPRVSAMTNEQANAVTPRVVRTTLLIMVVGGVVLAASSKFLILLFYGRQFLRGLSAMRILIPGVVFLSIFKVLSSDLSGRDRRIYNTIAASIAFGANAVLNLVLIPRMGISGAAAASTVSYAIQSIVMVAFFVKVSGVSAASVLLPSRDDIPHYARWIREAFKGLRTRFPTPEA